MRLTPIVSFLIACCASSALAEGGAVAAAPVAVPSKAADTGNDTDVEPADDVGNEDTGPAVPAEDRPAPAPPIDEELQKPFGTADIVKSLLRTVLMLAVVLGLVWLTLSKGMGKLVERANAGKRVKIIERVALDARRSLFLVEIDGKQMVLGGGDVVRIHDFAPSGSRGFAEVLTTQSAQPAQSGAAPRPPNTTSTAENA